MIELDQEKDLIRSETISYPLMSLLGDIGGAAGLFLGISVIISVLEIGNGLAIMKNMYNKPCERPLELLWEQSEKISMSTNGLKKEHIELSLRNTC